MSVYVATFREKDNLRTQHVAAVARSFGAGAVALEGVEDLVTHQMALPRHLWVPLELTTGATPLARFEHPEDVVYVLGPQNGTLPREALNLMETPVYVETDATTDRPVLLTPTVAGIVLHHRLVQLEQVAA